jgi:hypothetical protein
MEQQVQHASTMTVQTLSLAALGCRKLPIWTLYSLLSLDKRTLQLSAKTAQFKVNIQSVVLRRTLAGFSSWSRMYTRYVLMILLPLQEKLIFAVALCAYDLVANTGEAHICCACQGILSHFIAGQRWLGFIWQYVRAILVQESLKIHCISREGYFRGFSVWTLWMMPPTPKMMWGVMEAPLCTGSYRSEIGCLWSLHTNIVRVRPQCLTF